MKQTVEEAAKEFAKSVIDSFGTNGVPSSISDIEKMIALGFENGAEWQANQSPWISVEERLPDKNVYDWVLVIVRDKRDGFIGIPQIGELRSDGVWHTTASDDFNTLEFRREYGTTDVLGVLLKQEVIAWSPIPSFDQILEANKDVLQRMKEKGETK